MKTVYLSLGSNIGDRESHLRAAIGKLNESEVRVLRVSPIYETEPMGVTDQRWFLNLVVEAETALFPLQLLARTQKIELALGRVRTMPQGPRTLDIDILLYGASSVRTPKLEIPHPRMTERRFVLAPLADLAPELRHPISGKSVRELLDRAPQQVIRPL